MKLQPHEHRKAAQDLRELAKHSTIPEEKEHLLDRANGFEMLAKVAEKRQQAKARVHRCIIGGFSRDACALRTSRRAALFRLPACAPTLTKPCLGGGIQQSIRLHFSDRGGSIAAQRGGFPL